MYCHATISKLKNFMIFVGFGDKLATLTGANEEQKDKLNKLLVLWSSKANFFDSCAITKLQSPPSSLQEYQNTLLSQYGSVATPLSQATKATFDK